MLPLSEYLINVKPRMLESRLSNILGKDKQTFSFTRLNFLLVARYFLLAARCSLLFARYPLPFCQVTVK